MAKKPLHIYPSGKKIAPECLENPKSYLSVEGTITYWEQRLKNSQSSVIQRHARNALEACKRYKKFTAGALTLVEKPTVADPLSNTEAGNAPTTVQTAAKRKRKSKKLSKKEVKDALLRDRRAREQNTLRLRALRMEKEAKEKAERVAAQRLTEEQERMLNAMRANHEAWSVAFRKARKEGPIPFREEEFTKDQLAFCIQQVRLGLYPLWTARRAHWRDRGLTYVHAHSMISWVTKEKFEHAGFDPVAFERRALGRTM
ncbi:hypothetical protein [Ruegeria faecimaris]|uniref:hypothetical protein n=1 Tax=Ruegeria faecimaris TaxID=686389 RepID=UPI002493414B|nr:hypothetical protein [Ruegeria faecimaris]